MMITVVTVVLKAIKGKDFEKKICFCTYTLTRIIRHTENVVDMRRKEENPEYYTEAAGV